mmetsp:Transcript_33064/g.82810  ORF Transcript_33064/g.82810 Transcript_33064/m.82810 type:complete len:260 (+) Transcript_33064:80-859(+)
MARRGWLRIPLQRGRAAVVVVQRLAGVLVGQHLPALGRLQAGQRLPRLLGVPHLQLDVEHLCDQPMHPPAAPVRLPRQPGVRVDLQHPEVEGAVQQQVDGQHVEGAARVVQPAARRVEQPQQAPPQRAPQPLRHGGALRQLLHLRAVLRLDHRRQRVPGVHALLAVVAGLVGLRVHARQVDRQAVPAGVVGVHAGARVAVPVHEGQEGLDGGDEQIGAQVELSPLGALQEQRVVQVLLRHVRVGGGQRAAALRRPAAHS